MSGLFGRVFQYLVNEVAVKSLAQSQTFQRFAMRTHQSVEKTKGVVANSADKLHGNVKEAGSGFAEFRAALGEEIKKDWSKFQK